MELLKYKIKSIKYKIIFRRMLVVYRTIGSLRVGCIYDSTIYNQHPTKDYFILYAFYFIF
jgi:hypothetical protein